MFDIVMSLFNKEKFVEDTINSVLSQRHREWRLFAVDDGSTDRSAAIVEAFGDPRITLIRQKNQGVGPARNAGIRAGSSAWIAFLDADDVWNSDHLAELQATIDRHPGAVIVGSGFRRFSGKACPKQHSDGRDRRELVRYFELAARGREMFFTSSCAVRRSVLAAVGTFEPLPGNEDVELWARVALRGPVAVSDKQTVNYRVDTGGITDAGMAGRKEPARPTERDKMSSTIPTLTRLLPTVNDARLRRDIRAYMDSRVGLSLVAAVLDGNIAYARHVRSLYEGKPKGKARIAAAIARLPEGLAQRVVRSLRRLKGSRR